MLPNFVNPWFLLLIPTAAAYTFFMACKVKGLSVRRRNMIFILRSLIFSLIILCLAGTSVEKISDNVSTVFLIDSSDSAFSERQKVLDFLRNSIKTKNKNDKTSVINFGADCQIEYLPSYTQNIQKLQTKVKSNFTDIEQALEYASSIFSSNDKKRIVLMTDGLETTGDVFAVVDLLKFRKIALDIFRLDKKISEEVQVKEIKLPDSLKINETYNIEIKIISNVETKTGIKLYKDRELYLDSYFDIVKGENNFTFTDIAKSSGVITYTAEIEPDADTFSQNNKAYAFSHISGKANILVVQSDDNAGQYIYDIMKDEVNITLSAPQNLPLTLSEIQKYDSFILSNVSAENIDDRFLENLEICVRNLGKGVLVTGGSNSYALGGYYNTPLEKILPVSVDIKSDLNDPNLGLMLVIDKSGSMLSGQYGVSKLSLAREAAKRSAEVLKKNDMLGILAFDDQPQWVMKMQHPTDMQYIQNSIISIGSGGGTSIFNPLETAYTALSKVDTKLKHIILLTDGQAETTGYDSLLEKIRDAGITLSTVAVGDDADKTLLSYLAEKGEGRFYLTDEFSNIPKIFAKETFLAGKSYLYEESFNPSLLFYSPVLDNINTLPVLDGYIRTTAKSLGKVVLESPENEPVLAVWQYGTGRVIAWTSDIKGIWTQSWAADGSLNILLKNMVSYLSGKFVKGVEDGYEIAAEINNGKTELKVKIPFEESGSGKIAAVISGPSGEQSINLSPVSPNEYEGTFETIEQGAYMAGITVKNKDAEKTFDFGIIVPYSSEYNINSRDTDEFFERLVYESGGRIISNPQDVFTGILPKIYSNKDITHILLLTALTLFIFDIAIRRFNISFPRKAFNKKPEQSDEAQNKITDNPVKQNINSIEKILSKRKK